jgi:hypothetical protein
MHLLVFFFLIVGCFGDIKVSINEKGAYNISINDYVWLRSANTAIYADDRWYSTMDNSLPLTDVSFAEGNDPNLGSWNETQLNYDLVRSGIHTKIVGRIRQWGDISAITFHLDTGDQIITSTVPLNREQVRTIFPSLHIEQIDMNDDRGYFTFSGKIFLFTS